MISRCMEKHIYTTHHISRDSKVLAQFFCLYSCLMLMFHCSDLWAPNPGRSRFLLILDDHSGAVHASPEVRSLLIHSCRKVKQFGNLAKKPVLPDLNKNVFGGKSHWNDLRAPIGNYSCRDMHDPMNPLVLGVICLRPQLGSMLRWPLVCLAWKHSTAVILGFPCVRHKLQRDKLATNKCDIPEEEISRARHQSTYSAQVRNLSYLAELYYSLLAVTRSCFSANGYSAAYIPPEKVHVETENGDLMSISKRNLLCQGSVFRLHLGDFLPKIHKLSIHFHGSFWGLVVCSREHVYESLGPCKCVNVPLGALSDAQPYPQTVWPQATLDGQNPANHQGWW